MKLSIIIPVYNGENYISDCINSLLNQDLLVDDYEIIIVNDGSTDSTLAIVEEYKSNYSNVKLYTQKNSGVNIARNRGIDMAKGDYILFVDADDAIVNKSLKKALDYIGECDLDFLGFGIRHTATTGTDVEFDDNIQIVCQGSGNDIIEQFKYRNECWWYIYRKSKANDLRFIPAIYLEDLPFTPRLILSMQKCVVIKNEVYLYNTYNPNARNRTDFLNNKKMIEGFLFCVNNFDQLFSEYTLSDGSLQKLRARQESFLFFAIIRFIRLHTSFYIDNDAVEMLQFEDYKVYPIKQFKGDNILQKLLLFLINNKFLLKSLNYTNSKLKVIK